MKYLLSANTIRAGSATTVLERAPQLDAEAAADYPAEMND